MSNQSAILTEQDFRAVISSQCGMSPEERERRNKFAEGIAVALHTESRPLQLKSRPLQLKDREPTDAEVLSALQFALNDEQDRQHVREISYDQFQIDGGDE